MSESATATENPPAPPAPPAPAPTPDTLPNGLPVLEKRDPKNKIPGLDITWADAEQIELSDTGIVHLINLKRSIPGVKLFLIPLRDNQIFVGRSCKRQEWRTFAPKFALSPEEAEKVKNEPGMTAGGFDQISNMVYQERVVEKLLVYPQLNLQQIRSELDAGDVGCLFDSIMLCSGWGQQPRGVRL